ncbi:MAG TPA: hypothetical protein VFY10_14725, partial [Dehalococcoidia bacterium]|nr:hypothetical protein [Dehalococcoidia bacterium]
GLLNPTLPESLERLLWRAAAEGKHERDGGYETDYERATTLELVELPIFTPTQYVAFGIYCAQTVFNGHGWDHWAHDWFSGLDRSSESASASSVTEATSLSANFRSLMSLSAMMAACDAAQALANGSHADVTVASLSASACAHASEIH